MGIRRSHEDSDIIHDDVPSRKKVVRQDRHEIAEDTCTLVVNGGSYDVINYSSFGLAIFSEERLPDGFECHEAPLLLDGQEVCRVSLRKVREEALTGSAGFKTGFEVTGDPLDTDRMQTIINTKSVTSKISERLAELQVVPDGFRQKVLESKHILEHLQTELEAMRASQRFASREQLSAFEDAVVNTVAEYLITIFRPLYLQLANQLTGQPQAVVRSAFEFFREQLKNFIYQSPFADRTYNKPLGYAGDYEMMNIIYRNEVVGDSLFAKSLHRFYVNHHPETKAVRNRAQYLHRVLRNTLEKSSHPQKILSVASGPAMELQLLFQMEAPSTVSKAEFHLLDQDVISLKHAQRQIRDISRTKALDVVVKYFNTAIKNVIVKGLEESEYDVIYSAGLFDYFSDPVCQAAARRLIHALKPGGKLIIGNFNISTPNKFLMEIALDWRLIYRSPEDLAKLYTDLGGQLEVESEPEGVNLFCVIKKPHLTAV
jgi:extracellular factor (EF) 3-hydroxypalmitic acid methyl ester biosynthesis protein